MKRALLIVASLAMAFAVVLTAALRGSLPDLDGEVAVAHLGGAVVLERDALGAVTVRGPDRASVAFGTGFAHAQDRFFQMDLLRRDAAGELAALVGPGAVPRDEARRLHRLRSVARQVVEREEPAERALLEAYVRGVNAGLDALTVRPFEYLLLRAGAEPWRAEDTVLVIFAMYLQLNDEDARRDATLDALRETLSAEMFAFVTQAGTRWDAPLAGEPHVSLPPPGPGACDLRGAPALPALAEAVVDTSDESEAVLGSNAWVVSGEHTASGAALLANDMHLRLRVPNVWYRMRLVVEEQRGMPAKDLVGATLPGTPAMVVGSNRRVAWGFTNSRGDWSDRVRVATDPDEPGRYRVAGGSRSFEEHVETIAVKGGASRTVRVRETLWGPIVERRPDGAEIAVRWLAHLPEATNLRVLRIENARDAAEAATLARDAGIPPQNFMAADAGGGMAWTVAGRIPLRTGVDPNRPPGVPAGPGWRGWLSPGDYPSMAGHPSGRLWTANARVVDGEWLARMGDGGYAVGARASQIRDRLLAIETASESDMLAVQLDDRALFLEPWRDLLLATLDRAGPEPALEEMRPVVAGWSGRALPKSSGYRLVHRFRAAVHETVMRGVAHGCAGLGAGFRFEYMPQLEGVVWTLVTERPAHLLAPGFESWEALLVAAAREVLASCAPDGAAACPWGAVNRASVAHPLSRAVPALARVLDMAPRPVPGSAWVPRVQKGGSGASERLAVSPGHEESAYFHMPGGQSGHPLSSFYRAGHDAWVEGERLPLLPGPVRHRLTLRPARDG